MFIACVFSIVGGGLQAGSVNIGMYIVMRFITGVGIGKKKCGPGRLCVPTDVFLKVVW